MAPPQAQNDSPTHATLNTAYYRAIPTKVIEDFKNQMSYRYYLSEVHTEWTAIVFGLKFFETNVEFLKLHFVQYSWHPNENGNNNTIILLKNCHTLVLIIIHIYVYYSITILTTYLVIY